MRLSEEKWAEIMAGYEGRDCGEKEYAERNGVTVSALRYHRKRNSNGTPAAAIPFVRVRTAESSIPNYATVFACRIVLSNGVLVEIGEHASEDFIQRILSAAAICSRPA